MLKLAAIQDDWRNFCPMALPTYDFFFDADSATKQQLSLVAFKKRGLAAHAGTIL